MSWPKHKHLQKKSSGGAPFAWKMQEVSLEDQELRTARWGDVWKHSFLPRRALWFSLFIWIFIPGCYLWDNASIFTTELLIPGSWRDILKALRCGVFLAMENMTKISPRQWWWGGAGFEEPGHLPLSFFCRALWRPWLCLVTDHRMGLFSAIAFVHRGPQAGQLYVCRSFLPVLFCFFYFHQVDSMTPECQAAGLQRRHKECSMVMTGWSPLPMGWLWSPPAPLFIAVGTLNPMCDSFLNIPGYRNGRCQ